MKTLLVVFGIDARWSGNKFGVIQKQTTEQATRESRLVCMCVYGGVVV